MIYLHQRYLEHAEELRKSKAFVPNLADKVKQPNFEYEVVSSELWIFKQYKGRDILLRMEYLQNIKLFIVHIDEFYTEGLHDDIGEQTGLFTVEAQQIPNKIKKQKFSNIQGHIYEIKEEPNVRQNYYPLVKSALHFYRQIFPQANYSNSPNV